MIPTVSIIIVNYNTDIYLKKCLDTIIKNTKGITYEIIVIDNNSSRREIEKFPLIFPDVKFIFRNCNDGFGAGCNEGVRNSSSDFILIVNPDILFINNAVKLLYEVMMNYKGIGLCSPLFIDENGNSLFSFNKFPNLKWELIEFFGLDGTKSENKLLKLLDNHRDPDKPFYFDSVTGACMFLRKDIFLKVGGFDTKIFLYYEDTDIQKKISNAGYKIACIPAIKVIHHQNISTKKSGDENSYLLNLNRSKLIYYLNNTGVTKRTILRIMNILSYFLRLISLYLRLKYKSQRKQKAYQYLQILKYNLFYHTIKK
jgi:GT2 family glycosyltransferase